MRDTSRHADFIGTQSAIVSLIAAGATDKEIAAMMGISYRTVRTHLERLYVRYHVQCRAALVARTLEAGKEPSSDLQLPSPSRHDAP